MEVKADEAIMKTEPGQVLHYTDHQRIVIVFFISKRKKCASSRRPHNHDKGYWQSRATWILKNLSLKLPSDSTMKIVHLLCLIVPSFFLIVSLTIGSLSQSSLDQNISRFCDCKKKAEWGFVLLYNQREALIVGWWTLHHLLTTAWMLRGRCSCISFISVFCEFPVKIMSTYIHGSGRCHRAEACIKSECSLIPFSEIQDNACVFWHLISNTFADSSNEIIGGENKTLKSASK